MTLDMVGFTEEKLADKFFHDVVYVLDWNKDFQAQLTSVLEAEHRYANILSGVALCK